MHFGKRALGLAVLVLTFGMAMGEDALLPWDDKGQFYSERNRVHVSSGTLSPIIADTVVSSYVNRFGALPNVIIWDDYQNDPILRWTVGFRRYNSGVGTVAPPVPWGDTLMWKDVKPHLYWQFVQMLTDSVSYYPVTGPPDDKIVSFGFDTMNGWGAAVEIPFRDLRIPNDGSAYRLQMAVFKDDPRVGDEVFLSDDWYYVIRTTRSTVIDTFMWAYNEGFIDQKPILLSLLPHFQMSQLLMKRLFTVYMVEDNCDSLQSIAGRLWYAINLGIDPLVGHASGAPPKLHVEIQYADTTHHPSTMEEYMRAGLFDVCGDSTIPAWQP